MEAAAAPAIAEIPLSVDSMPCEALRLGRGWYYLEQNDAGASYRWTEPEFEIHVGEAAECLVVEYIRPGDFGDADCLVVGPDGWVEYPVHPRRAKLVIDLAKVAAGPATLRLSLSKTGRASADPREFGLCVHQIALLSGVAANRARRDCADMELPTTVRHLPVELSIAATDKCNLRCVMCGSHHAQKGDNNAGKEEFSGSLIRKVEPLAAAADSVQLHGGGGEPLFNPQFWQLAAGFSRTGGGRNIEIHTNGLLFNERNIALLMESAITHVSLSFDAASEPMYRRVRGGNFQKLLDNAEQLVAARQRSGRSDLRLTANMTMFVANAHEAAPLVALAHRLGIDAVMLMHLNGGDSYDWIETKPDGWVFDYRANLPTADPRHVRQCMDAAGAVAAELNYELIVDPRLQTLDPGEDGPAPAEEAEKPPADEAPPPIPRGPCYSDCRTPWNWLNIAANGDVSPCCWARRPLGNLNDTASLAEIWNGRRIRELRHNIRENRIDPEICEGASCVYVTAGAR